LAGQVPSFGGHTRSNWILQMQFKSMPHYTDGVVAEDTGGHLREWFLRSRGRIAVIWPDRYLAALTDENGIGPAIQQLRQLLDPKGGGWTAAGGKPRAPGPRARSG
jgi:hypothetical protein